MDITDLKEISKIVVKVNTADGSGSGFYLKNKGIVVTNHHVINGLQRVAIETQEKQRYSAKVVFVDPTYDVAFLLPTDKLAAPEATFQSVTNTKNMDRVSVLGFPFGMPFTITEGIVSSTKQLLDGKNYIQTDAAVNPGNSGGPLINERSQIVGITTCKFNNADNVGFALPIDNIQEDLEAFAENKEMKYSVKCPGCSHLIYEETEYCQNCGNKLDVHSLFTERTLSPLTLFIEEAIQDLDMDPILARKGYEFWEFYQGTALIRMFVFKNNYLYATCPLVKLPKTKLEELYKYMLEKPAAPFCLGISESVIYLSYRVHVADILSIHRQELKKNFTDLAKKADELDHYLIETYGCERSEYAKDSV